MSDYATNELINAITSPTGHSLYSAQYPYLIDANLWPNSWRIKPRPTPTITIGRKNQIPFKFLPTYNIVKESEITKKDIIKSLISLLVNLNMNKSYLVLHIKFFP